MTTLQQQRPAPTTDAAEGAFTVTGVVAGYGPVTVLRELELVVPPRSVVALLGPNGAGKTTFLRVASGLLPVRAGRMTFGSTDITGWSADRIARAGICHVPEGRGIFRRLTVRENIFLQAAPGQDAEALERAVSAFPVLGERLNQVSGSLSGGQQQMLALARAYVQSPKLVLLDEVSMGLAPLVVEEIFQFLREMAAAGAALLLVEQYVEQALQLADYAYVLNRGRVSFAGEAAELRGTDVFSHYLGDGT